MSNPQKILIIASVCHALNAAIAIALGEENIVDWNHAPDEIKRSCVSGVEYHLENPDVTPEQSHEAWRKWRGEQGWQYGDVKDVENKLHPNMVPFGELPIGQQMKDHVFRAAVHALKDLPLEAVIQAAQAAQRPAPDAPMVPAVVPKGFMPIKYVGPRETYREGMYGTGLVFHKGQTLPVPGASAVKMLRHPDVYVLGEIAQAEAAEVPAATTNKPTEADKDKEEEAQQDQRDAIGRMTSKKAVTEFVKTNFNQELDGRSSLADLKEQAIQLIDRFGVPA